MATESKHRTKFERTGKTPPSVLLPHHRTTHANSSHGGEMNTFTRSLVLTCALASGSAGACPPGSVAQKGNGWEGCVSGSNSGPPVWADRWGAIAIDEHSGSFGSSSSETSKAKAEKYALSMCKKSKASNCKIVVSYYNQCVGFVAGKNWPFIRTDRTIEAAVSGSLNRCERQDRECRVFYSRCSLPEQVQ